MRNTKQRKIVPIFFSVDNCYAPYLTVALESLKSNATDKYFYDINILTEGLDNKYEKAIKSIETENVKISLCDVSEKARTICARLHLRDYYTKATYYRFFIPEMFPQYDKGLYLDCDIAINRDVADMYNTFIGNNLVGAIPDEIITDIDVFGRYSEVVLGIPKNKYFNAGILVMNLAEMRKIGIESVFTSLLSLRTYSVAQDQDYLNVICYGRVKYLNKLWNKTPMPSSDPNKTPYVAHYKINYKPWKYDGVIYGEQFWKYAKATPFYDELLKIKNSYTDSEKARDAEQYAALEALAQREIDEEMRKSSLNSGIVIMGLESIAEDYICCKNRLLTAEEL